jgi:hypothetical protein
VADRISSAWLVFARTGDPATPELPWPVWRPDSRATIVSDTGSRVVNGFREDERTLLAGLSTKGPFGGGRRRRRREARRPPELAKRRLARVAGQFEPP